MIFWFFDFCQQSKMGGGTIFLLFVICPNSLEGYFFHLSKELSCYGNLKIISLFYPSLITSLKYCTKVSFFNFVSKIFPHPSSRSGDFLYQTNYMLINQMNSELTSDGHKNDKS